MSSRFEGKVALVFGGNSGIGRAAALAYAAERAAVVITGRDARTLAAVAAEIGPGTLAIQSDIAELAAHDEVVRQVRERHGRVDVLFVNAGVGGFAPVPLVTPELWDQVHDVNLRGCFFAAQKVLPLMGRGGAIVFTGSIGSQLAAPANVVYAASKAGLRAVVRIFAVELVGQGIRVNMVSPGPTETPALETTTGLTAEQAEQAAGQFAAQIPMGRRAKPEEIAAAVTFLASDESSYITGVDLAVDGGMAQV